MDNYNEVKSTLCKAEPVYFCEFIDPDTGVHYLVYENILYGGRLMASITPRLNADGTIMVTEASNKQED